MVNGIRVIAALASLIVVAGCIGLPDIFVLNTFDNDVSAVTKRGSYVWRGRSTTRFFDGTFPYGIDVVFGSARAHYGVTYPAQEYFTSGTFKDALYLILERDSALYVAASGKDGSAVRLVKQPEGYPVFPQSMQRDGMLRLVWPDLSPS